MNDDVSEISLGEAASRFLSALTAEARASSQPEVNHFVRWFGSQRPIARLTAAEIENFAERLSQSDKDYSRKLDIVKAFLTMAKKSKWTTVNLATNLKPHKSKTKTKQPAPNRPQNEKIYLTQQGYDELEAELAELKTHRLDVIEDMRRAAADKDFRENAPLHAAREEKGHIEGRILELESTLKSAEIMNESSQTSVRVSIGNTVVLCEIDTEEEMRCMLVSPREVDLVKGKISSASPIGQAIMGKGEGDTAEVSAPVGKLRYKIKKVE